MAHKIRGSALLPSVDEGPLSTRFTHSHVGHWVGIHGRIEHQRPATWTAYSKPVAMF